MENKFHAKNHRILIFLQIFLPGIFILFIQYIWKMLYIKSVIPGIYWLFVFLDGVYLPSILVSAVIGIILLFLNGLAGTIWMKHSIPLKYSLSMFFLSFAILLTFPITFAHNTVHIQQIRAEDKIYYLGAYPMFDINFFVAECDSLGIFCRTIFHSGDVTDTNWEDSHLKFDTNSHELKVEEPKEGIIFTYVVP